MTTYDGTTRVRLTFEFTPASEWTCLFDNGEEVGAVLRDPNFMYAGTETAVVIRYIWPSAGEHEFTIGPCKSP